MIFDIFSLSIILIIGIINSIIRKQDKIYNGSIYKDNNIFIIDFNSKAKLIFSIGYVVLFFLLINEYFKAILGYYGLFLFKYIQFKSNKYINGIVIVKFLWDLVEVMIKDARQKSFLKNNNINNKLLINMYNKLKKKFYHFGENQYEKFNKNIIFKY